MSAARIYYQVDFSLSTVRINVLLNVVMGVI